MKFLAKFLLSFVLTIVILGGALFAGWQFIGKPKLKEAAIREIGVQAGLSAEEIEYVQEILTDEENAFIDEMIDKAVSPQTIREVTGYLTDGDMESAAETVQELFTSDDLYRMEAIYEAHMDDPRLQQMIQEHQ